ncbi:hypothetical protein SUGI_0542370 [Cryptomeria japonica]|nr:hypothetical protein SUGI_0542370 [Cryptomeria japonica]
MHMPSTKDIMLPQPKNKRLPCLSYILIELSKPSFMLFLPSFTISLASFKLLFPKLPIFYPHCSCTSSLVVPHTTCSFPLQVLLSCLSRLVINPIFLFTYIYSSKSDSDRLVQH